MTFIITAVDNFLNLSPSANEFKKAADLGDNVGALQATVEFGKGTADTTNYAILGFTKAMAFASVLTDVSEKVTNVVKSVLAVDVLGGLGVVIGSLTVIIQSIAIHRQGQVLSTIPEKARLTEDRNLVLETVENLEKININHLKKSLPTLMREKVGENFIRDLKSKARNEPTEAIQILEEIRNYAFKKRVVHILTLIGGIITLAAGIGLLVSFPPMILLVLSAASIALTITCVVLNKGWVENTKEGFDVKLLLPQSLRDKLKTEEKEPNNQLELVSVHDGIVQRLQIMKENEQAAIKEFPVHRNVDANGQVIEKKKPSLWNTLLGLFVMKKDPSFEIDLFRN